MKTSLLESRQIDHNKRLSLVADSLALNLIDNDGLDVEDAEDSMWMIGRLKDWVDSKLLSDLYTRLRELKIVVDPDQSVSNAKFNPSEKALIIGAQGEPSASSLSSIVVHELRHALDHSLSKGKALRGQGLKGSFKDYLLQQHEINARFSQVLNDIRSVDKSEDMKTTIIDLMDKHKLTDVFPSSNYKRITVDGNVIRIPYDNKTFRKLYGRAVRYWRET